MILQPNGYHEFYSTTDRQSGNVYSQLTSRDTFHES